MDNILKGGVKVVDGNHPAFRCNSPSFLTPIIPETKEAAENPDQETRELTCSKCGVTVPEDVAKTSLEWPFIDDHWYHVHGPGHHCIATASAKGTHDDPTKP